jgi:hypothetical protein
MIRFGELLENVSALNPLPRNWTPCLDGTTERGTALKRRLSAVLVALAVCLTLTFGQAGQVDSGSLASRRNGGTPQQCGYALRLDVVPSFPTEGDAVQITVSGDWPNSCRPEYQTHKVGPGAIGITSVCPPDAFCADVITPWGFTVDVGSLSSGPYEAQLYITNSISVTTLCAMQSFEVQYRMYLPLVVHNNTGP